MNSAATRAPQGNPGADRTCGIPALDDGRPQNLGHFLEGGKQQGRRGPEHSFGLNGLFNLLLDGHEIRPPAVPDAQPPRVLVEGRQRGGERAVPSSDSMI